MRTLFSLILVILVFQSCKISNRVFRRSEADQKKELSEILAKVTTHENNRPERLLMKGHAKFMAEGKERNAKFNVRLVPDSAIWISFTSMNYEGVRMLLTPDSVRFINRLDKNYYMGDYGWFEKTLGIRVDFQEVQSVLLGHTIYISDNNDVELEVEETYYVLSTFVGGTTQNSDSLYYISNFLDPGTYKTLKLSAFDFSKQREIIVEYIKFEAETPYHIPSENKVYIKGAKPSDADITVSKVSEEKSLKFPFKIPSKYNAIN
jgi:hypothetical protein